MSITVIFPNTPSASSLAPAEVDKRVSSFNQRRTQLKSNPSLYVSRTRLSVRRIPPFVTERGLRRLARCAVRTFEVEQVPHRVRTVHSLHPSGRRVRGPAYPEASRTARGIRPRVDPPGFGMRREPGALPANRVDAAGRGPGVGPRERDLG